MPDDAEPDELELEDFGGADLPPPPPPPAPAQHATAAPPAPPPPELIAISKRIAGSTDNLEQQALVHSALCASIADVLSDPLISAEQRRKELRTISAAAAKCFPYKRLYEAEQLIKNDQAILDNRRKERAGAALEKREARAGGGKLIPIRGSAIKDRDDGLES